MNKVNVFIVALLLVGCENKDFIKLARMAKDNPGLRVCASLNFPTVVDNNGRYCLTYEGEAIEVKK